MDHDVKSAAGPAGVAPPSRRSLHLRTRSVILGAVGASGLLAFYAAVLSLSSGLGHVADQAAADWYWLTLIVAGFGTQVALFSELRRRAGEHHAAMAGAGVGAGASAFGMVACCAHHLADLLPLVAAGTVAATVVSVRVPLMIVAIVVNAVAIVVTARRLLQVPPVSHEVHE